MSKQVIYKYPLKDTEYQSIVLPSGSRILTIRVQNGELYVWAFVNLNQHFEQRNIRILHTGQESLFTDNLVYIDTVICDESHVLHVFEDVTNKSGLVRPEIELPEYVVKKEEPVVKLPDLTKVNEAGLVRPPGKLKLPPPTVIRENPPKFLIALVLIGFMAGAAGAVSYLIHLFS